MYTNKIGVKHALFWIAWAFVAEKQANVKFADQVFLKGQKYLAEPKDLLSLRYHQFQRRMTRKFLNGEDVDISTLHSKDKLKSTSEVASRRGLTVISERKNSGNPQKSSSDKPNAAAFEIFTDNGQSSRPVKGTWNNLGTDSERRKENTGTKF
jgi:hypothetical protein